MAAEINKLMILLHLEEGLGELERTVQELKTDAEYGQGEFVVAMSHLYHHLNMAWNARFETDEKHRECTPEDFRRWRKFPRDKELLLDL